MNIGSNAYDDSESSDSSDSDELEEMEESRIPVTKGKCEVCSHEHIILNIMCDRCQMYSNSMVRLYFMHCETCTENDIKDNREWIGFDLSCNCYLADPHFTSNNHDSSHDMEKIACNHQLKECDICEKVVCHDCRMLAKRQDEGVLNCLCRKCYSTFDFEDLQNSESKNNSEELIDWVHPQ